MLYIVLIGVALLALLSLASLLPLALTDDGKANQEHTEE
jgi:hypothetical protein